jgi:Domain of unknown function (DUF6431)/Homeodomain-like domain
MPEVAPVLMVEIGVPEVERDLRAGVLCCPSCAGALGPWGWARRRCVRSAERGALLALRPRRARCRGCGGTHVLLPDVCLLRRQYEAAVIGAALEAKMSGLGYRRIAVQLGVPADTVRSWLRRFRDRSQMIRSHFVRWAHAVDPELGSISPAGSRFAEAIGAIGVAAGAWVRRFGRRGLWRLVSWLSGGLLLATRVAPFPAVP